MNKYCHIIHFFQTCTSLKDNSKNSFYLKFWNMLTSFLLRWHHMECLPRTSMLFSDVISAFFFLVVPTVSNMKFRSRNLSFKSYSCQWYNYLVFLCYLGTIEFRVRTVHWDNISTAGYKLFTNELVFRRILCHFLLWM